MGRRRLILNDAYKQFTTDQDKIMPPGETVKQFKNKLAKLDLDILKGTERIDNGRLGIPVYFSVCGKDAAVLTGNSKQMGKGATPQQAEASAVMELAERFSFFSFSKNDNNFFVEKYSNLKDKAISFEMIARSVHDTSDDLERAKKVFENIPLKWTKAFNLTRNEEVLYPFDWFFAINEFNGPSAGNCKEEAIIQGICEVVERHVSSIISRNRLNVPAIRLDSPTEPMVVEIINKYKKAGINLFVSDFTLDIGIPTVGVLAYDPVTFPDSSEIVWTAGTTPDPQKALSRALTETAQLGGDFNTSSNYVASGLPKFLNIEDSGYIMSPGKKTDIASLPDLSDDNIKIEIENCISALDRKGLEVILVDIMHPLLEIPAFYTIIPGAHFRERAAGTGVGMFSAKLIAEKYKPPDAVAELKKAEKILPGKYYIQFYLGLSYYSMDDYNTALTFFKTALELNPVNEDIPSIYSYMGACLKNMGKYDHALEILKEGEKYDKERTDIYNLMGFCYFKQKKHEKAIESFKKTIQLDPGSAIDYANIASNYRDIGNREQAIYYYQTALTIDPSIDFARDNLKKLL